MKQFILASQSPRRKKLLEQIGVQFSVDPSNVTEIVDKTLLPEHIVMNISRDKALHVSKRYSDAVILACDSLVICEKQILGKPKDAFAAKQMLQLLSGKKHTVFSGFTIIDTKTRKTVTDFVSTDVFIRELNEQEIDAYIATGEPLDKAGGYGAQEKGALLIDRIEGDFSTVVGLPLARVAQALKQFQILVLQ